MDSQIFFVRMYPTFDFVKVHTILWILIVGGINNLRNTVKNLFSQCRWVDGRERESNYWGCETKQKNKQKEKRRN